MQLGLDWLSILDSYVSRPGLVICIRVHIDTLIVGKWTFLEDVAWLVRLVKECHMKLLSWMSPVWFLFVEVNWCLRPRLLINGFRKNTAEIRVHLSKGIIWTVWHNLPSMVIIKLAQQRYGWISLFDLTNCGTTSVSEPLFLDNIKWTLLQL